ncbi:MAG: FkbM family methyltransferase [Phycisphaerales bacterium]
MPLFKCDAYAMMTRLLDPGEPAVFLDVGANTGQTCRRICDEFFRSTVYAFEPAPDTAARLRENTRDLPEVHIVESAVGDRTGTLDLHIAANDLMSSALAPSDLGARFYGPEITATRTVRVPATTVDDFVASHKLARVDMLKIDVQGLECAVLAGAGNLLTRGDVLAVNCEAQLLPEYAGASTFSQIDAALAALGYTLHQIHECWSHGAEEQTSCLDALWLRNDALARLRDRCALTTPRTRLLRAARHAAAAGKKSLALYGAGRHTRALAQHFDECAVKVCAILDDAATAEATPIAGRPVVSPDQAASLGVDAVVISSECYEEELLHAAAPLRQQGILVMPLYRSPSAAGVPQPTTITASPSPADPARAFRYRDYLRLNQRRLDHLASLDLPLDGRRVLEVGAGVGDLTGFWLDRGCAVHATDARPDHVRLIARTHSGRPGLSLARLDLDAPLPFTCEPFDIVFAYGLLYHLNDPVAGLAYMSAACRGTLLLETCVSPGEGESLNPVAEDRAVPSQALSGTGCRPTRAWVYARLREAFPHVYMPRTQPDHEEFPLDWSAGAASASRGDAARLTRAVFVASREPIANVNLIGRIPERQTVCSRAAAQLAAV